MRLLDTKKLRVVEFADNAIPSYSILSHTWGDQEITYQDIVSLSSGSRNLSAVFNLDSEVKSKKGFAKVKNAAALAAEDGFAYLWIDTCCIDKASSAELSEAINSMYRWYEESDLCYAYLSDVVPAREELPSAANSTFRRSRWFTRGWTLQELLAPKEVRFFASDWSYLGSQSQTASTSAPSSIPPSPNIIGKNLLTEITSIDQRVLQGTLEPRQVSVATRMSWAASRETTRLEDIAYCLLGVFSVNMPLLYGEGRRAFVRLQEAILRETDDQSIFAWKSLSRDAPNHLSGLLADSPKLFQTARNIRALPPLLTGDKVPTVMSSQGLQVQLFLKPVGKTHYYGILDCSVRSWLGAVEYPAIVLQRLWGNQYARIRSNVLVMVKLPSSESSASEAEGRYQAIYVQREPVWILPEFSYDGVSIGDGIRYQTRGQYMLVDVYPPERWDPLAMALQSDRSRLGMVMGVFGFSMPTSSGERRVAVIVTLRSTDAAYEADHILETWDGSLTLQDIYYIYNRAGGIGTNRREQRLSELECEAIVREVSRRGRPCLSVEVVRKSEVEGDAGISYEVVPAPRPTRRADYNATPMLAKPVLPQTPIFSPRDLDEITAKLEILLRPVSITDNLVYPLLRHTQPQHHDFIRLCSDYGGFGQSETLLYAFAKVMEPLVHLIPRITFEMEKLYSLLLKFCVDGELDQPITFYSETAKMGLDMNARVRGFYNWRPLHLAAAAGQYAAVQHLIEQGADIFNTADGGLTALHVAAFMGHTTIVTTLLSHIPDAGTEKRFLMAQTGGSMETALHLAAASHYCSDALLNALCTRGERVYWTGLANLQGERPIHRAAASQHPEALKWFLSVVKQWNLDEEDRFGRTPLWHAAAVGSVDGVRRLARAGASVNHADMYGRTPLHIAVCEGHEDVVTCLLLEYEANSWRATKQVALTPVHFAAMLGRTRCLQLLLSCGARVNDPIPELKDLLPVSLAAMHGHDQGVAAIVKADESMGLARGFFTFNIHTVRQPPRILVLRLNQWIDGLGVDEMREVAEWGTTRSKPYPAAPTELPDNTAISMLLENPHFHRQ